MLQRRTSKDPKVHNSHIRHIMFSKIAITCAISSMASTDAFTIIPNKISKTNLNYRNQYDDLWNTNHQLPSGAFGILPSPIEQDIAMDPASYSSVIEPEPFITASHPQNISYSPKIDLPTSASIERDIEFENVLEISLGRVAMMAALVLIVEEIWTGHSFPEQLVRLIGGIF